jgi:outer membrane protein assembly factor BamA
LRGHSRLTFSIIPDLQRKTLVSSGRDTARVLQTFGAIAYSIDRKVPFFDPDHGWYLSTELRSNYLYAEGLHPYCQYTLDTRYFHQGFFDGQKFGVKAMTVLRTSDAGYFNRLFLGGTLTLRGYDQNEIGLSTIANDLFMASTEYRFTIGHLPAIHYTAPRIAEKVVSYATEFKIRVDGALLCDYGVVTANTYDLTHQNGASRQSGTGVGFSLRLLEIPLQGRVNLDVVWIDNPATKALDFGPWPTFNINADIGY